MSYKKLLMKKFFCQWLESFIRHAKKNSVSSPPTSSYLKGGAFELRNGSIPQSNLTIEPKPVTTGALSDQDLLKTLGTPLSNHH